MYCVKDGLPRTEGEAASRHGRRVTVAEARGCAPGTNWRPAVSVQQLPDLQHRAAVWRTSGLPGAISFLVLHSSSASGQSTVLFTPFN